MHGSVLDLRDMTLGQDHNTHLDHSNLVSDVTVIN